MLEHRVERLENLACNVHPGLQADAETPKIGGPGRENMVTYPPHDAYLSEAAISWIFQKDTT